MNTDGRDREAPRRQSRSIPPLTALLMVVCVALAGLPDCALALPEQIHTLISFEAAGLPGVPEEFRSPDVLGPPNGQPPHDDDALITEGSFDEDIDRYPDVFIEFLRIFDRDSAWGWGSHFWDPSAGAEHGQLLLLNPPPPQNAYQRGRMLYEQALAIYPSDPGRAYYLLGRVAHLLADMATPSHTHLDPHVSDTLADFLRLPGLGVDSLEVYLQRTYVTVGDSVDIGDVPGRAQFEQDFVADDLVPVPPAYLSDAGRSDLGDLFKLFHTLATHAARWDSDDNDGTGPQGTGSGSLRVATTTANGVRLYHISDADCGRIAADTMPRAITHVATLYRIFWRDTHPQETLPDAQSLAGDIDGSGTVGTFDLMRLVTAFGTTSGQSGYDPAADLDASGMVDVADLQILVSNFGHTR